MEPDHLPSFRDQTIDYTISAVYLHHQFLYLIWTLVFWTYVYLSNCICTLALVVQLWPVYFQQPAVTCLLQLSSSANYTAYITPVEPLNRVEGCIYHDGEGEIRHRPLSLDKWIYHFFPDWMIVYTCPAMTYLLPYQNISRPAYPRLDDCMIYQLFIYIHICSLIVIRLFFQVSYGFGHALFRLSK